jgi:hypothetical protein
MPPFTRGLLATLLAVLPASLSLAPPASATHEDGVAKESVLYSWETKQFDILILPPAAGPSLRPYEDLDVSLPLFASDRLTATQASLQRALASLERWGDRLERDGPGTFAPQIDDRVDTAEAAVEAWRRAIAADARFADVEMRAFVVGRDVIPVDALADPEILVVTTRPSLAHMEVTGIAQHLDFACRAPGFQGGRVLDLVERMIETALRTDAPRPSHDAIHWEACPALENLCVSYGLAIADARRAAQYNIVAHEFGHCLGIGHVGKEPDGWGAQPEDHHPHGDVMSYFWPESGLACPSTLNLRALERVFEYVDGRGGRIVPPDERPAKQAEQVELSMAEYAATDCNGWWTP